MHELTLVTVTLLAERVLVRKIEYVDGVPALRDTAAVTLGSVYALDYTTGNGSTRKGWYSGDNFERQSGPHATRAAAVAALLASHALRQAGPNETLSPLWEDADA